MKNDDNNENIHSSKKTKKTKKSIELKNSEEKTSSKIKNSIFNKVIIKSNSIISNNNNEHYLFNYKNKMSTKNSPFLPKINNQSKKKNNLKSKIKTTFSNYYTDFIFKNNNKQHFNFTEVNNVGDDTDEISHIQLNNETNDDTLKTNRLKYIGLYNTDSSQKINFNICINNSNSINNSKDFSPYSKGSILISPQNNKKNNKENKINFDNSNKKKQKPKIGLNIEKKNNININNSNKCLKKIEDIYKNNNKNIIKPKKANNITKSKKEEKEKNERNNNERNKQNKKKIFNSNNKTSQKKNNYDNISKRDRHIFLSPMQKNINNIIVKIKSSTKKANKMKYKNLVSHYNTTSSTSNKENKKIIFQRKENLKLKNNNKNATTFTNINGNLNNSNIKRPKNKRNINNTQINLGKEKFTKLNINTQININSFKEELEVNNNIETDIYKLMNEHKENTPTIISEDKSTEKDLYLGNNINDKKNENNDNNDNNKTLKNDNNKLIDYFKTARKALKNVSHSLINPSNSNYLISNNKIINDNDNKNIFNESNNISIKNKEDESHNYKIKKVPIFLRVNVFPQINARNINNFLLSVFCEQYDEKSKLNNVKQYILFFLDDKSIMFLSCVNKSFYENIRIIFYTNISNKIYKNNIFIKKINDSVIKIVSKKLNKNKTQLESMYESFCNQTSYIDIILNDLSRTFPNDLKFQKNEVNYNKLYNILTKYSIYNPVIGYAQGLNFLFANALYLYDNEKNAFYYIDGLIKRFGLENYLAEKNSKLTIEISKFSKILSKYIPDIIHFFDEKLINHEFFSTGWILTLFSNSMNYSNLFICWNFMIIFGWKFFYCFVIQILIYYKNLIFNTKENDLSQTMKNLLKTQKFNQDMSKIINNALIFMQKYIVL